MYALLYLLDNVLYILLLAPFIEVKADCNLLNSSKKRRASIQAHFSVVVSEINQLGHHILTTHGICQHLFRVYFRSLISKFLQLF